MGKKNKVISEAKSKVINFYGTKADWFVADLENVYLSDLFSNANREQAVVAKDETGYYVTGRSFLGAPVLDPYRVYTRIVPEQKTSTGEDGTEVTKYFIPAPTSNEVL